MQADTGAFQALTAQVEQLAERVEQLHQQAFIIRTLDEMALERAGYGYDGTEGTALRAAWEAGRASAGGDTTPRPAPRRPRHLSVVSGGGS
jgi:hypothetical protein